jgi:hypothetical protein
MLILQSPDSGRHRIHGVPQGRHASALLFEQMPALRFDGQEASEVQVDEEKTRLIGLLF